MRFGAGIVASIVLVAAAGLAVLALGSAALPGHRVTTVASGSMEPALHVGDAVVVQDHPPASGMLGAPSIVLVDRPGQVPLLHRVLDDDGQTYRTKGDANLAPDSDRVDPSRVLGVGVLVVPLLGWPALWAQSGDFAALAALLAALVVLLNLVRYGWMDRYDPWALPRGRAGAVAGAREVTRHGPTTGWVRGHSADHLTGLGDEDGEGRTCEHGASAERDEAEQPQHADDHRVGEVGSSSTGGRGRGAERVAAGTRSNAERFDTVTPHETDQGADRDPEASLATSPTAESPTRRIRAGGFVGVAVTLVLVLVMGASDSAFSATASTSDTLTAVSVAAPTALTATRCSRAPVVVASSTAGPADRKTLTIPTQTMAGDNLLLSRAGIRSSSSSGYVDPETPLGWTRLGIRYGGGGRFHAVYWRTATVSDAGSDMIHSTEYADVLLIARGGTIQAPSVDGENTPVWDKSVAGQVDESGSTATAPSVSGQAGGMLLTFWAVERGKTSFSAPTGMSTVVAENHFFNNISMAVHSQLVTADGDTGTRSAALTDAGSGNPADARHSGLSLFVRSDPFTALTWAPAASARTTGYRITRDGATVATVPGAATSMWGDSRSSDDSTPTYTITTIAKAEPTAKATTAPQEWTSPAVSTTAAAGTC